MPLVVGSLQSGIQRVFDQQLEDIQDIARQIAQAYQSYAATAQSPIGAPAVLKGTENRLFEIALFNLMKSQAPPPQAANQISQAITGFWLTPPVTFGPGLVTAVIAQAGVGRLIGTNVKDSSNAAATLAQSLDVMTKTVFVTNPPPAPSGPII
jgi:hypothetical protein